MSTLLNLLTEWGFHYLEALTKFPISLQLDYGSNSPSWTFGSKHPLHFSRVIPLLNNLSSDTPHLRKFLSKIYKDWSHKNPSNRTLSSKIQEKLGLNGALKICKLWNNGALKNTLRRLKYIQEWFGKVKLMKQWRLEPFYRRKKSN